MNSLENSIRDAETEWLEKWTAGPTERRSSLVHPGSQAPNLTMPDENGSDRQLSEFWATGPALIMFWRHFGCSCGFDRAERLAAESDAYRKVNLTPVIVAQGEPERAAQYKATHNIEFPILCDPNHQAYEAYGVEQWDVEQVLLGTPSEWWTHPHELGIQLQDERRKQGKPVVDDPWRATAEFVVGTSGTIRLSYDYQECEDYPEPELLTMAALLS